MIFVAQPFSVEAGDAPTELQVELIDLQCNQFIKSKFNETPLIDFNCVYVLRKLSQPEGTRSTSNLSFLQYLPFRTIVLRITQTKSKVRCSITGGHLEQCFRLATTSVEDDIDCLVREKRWQDVFLAFMVEC